MTFLFDASVKMMRRGNPGSGLLGEAPGHPVSGNVGMGMKRMTGGAGGTSQSCFIQIYTDILCFPKDDKK